MHSLWALFASLLLTVATLNAATIDLQQMPSGPPVIWIRGPIELGDERLFAATALAVERATILLESPGGNLHAAMEIGRAVRIKGFATFVGRGGAGCASACALIWLAGAPRVMAPDARIGFHAASFPDSSVTSAGNALAGAYLSQLGLSSRFIAFATTPGPETMAWLTPELVGRLGLEVRILPPGGPPSSTRPTETDIRTAANKLILSHFQALSGERHTIQSHVDSFYSDTVEHNGRVKKRSDILQDHLAYIERWPVRSYRIQNNDFRISCSDQHQCTASMFVEWSANNTIRRITSTGTSEVVFSIDFSRASPRIFKETSRVINRTSYRPD